MLEKERPITDAVVEGVNNVRRITETIVKARI
jgi:hypothetical protein